MQRCNGVLAPVSMQFHPAALRAVLCQVDALDEEQEIESREHRFFSVPFEVWYSV